MIDGRKYEIFLEMQQRNRTSFTKTGSLNRKKYVQNKE